MPSTTQLNKRREQLLNLGSNTSSNPRLDLIQSRRDLIKKQPKKTVVSKKQPQTIKLESPKSVFDHLQRVAGDVGRFLQKTPNADLGFKGQDFFQATDTETAAVNFISNMPSSFLQSWGQTLEQVSTKQGRDQVKNDAINLPKTVEQVKDHVLKKEWQQAYETAMSNTAFTVALDVSDFIPASLLAKAGLKPLKALSKERNLAKTLVKDAIKEAEKTVVEPKKPKIVSGEELGFRKVEKPKIDYTPAKNLTPEAREIETKFAKEINEDLDKTISNYKKANGNVINTDLARELSPEYANSKATRSMHSATVHEPASALVKEIYTRELAKPAPKGQIYTVLFTGGGTGAGKSKSLEGLIDAKKYQIVYDTNLNTLDSSVQKIEQALKANKKVEIVYIYRDPIEALQNGTLTRAMRMGRTVPLENHLETHLGAMETARKLDVKYKDNPNVEINFIDNSLGKGNQKLSTVDVFNKTQYNRSELKKQLNKVADNEYKQGKISKEVYEGTTGKSGQKDSASDGTKPQKKREVVSEETITKETKKKAPYSSKEARAVQESFTNQLSRISRTAKTQEELIKKTNKVFNEAINKLKGDRSGLAGLRTALSKEMFDLAGVSGTSYKQRYAELKSMFDDPSIGKYLEDVEAKIEKLDEMIKNTPETTKVITRKTEKIVTERSVQQPIGTGETRQSRLAQKVEAKAVANQLTDSLGDLPEFKRVNLEDQANKAVDYLAKNPEKAIEIALGKKAPPANILPESIFTAVENQAIKDKNLDLIRQLGQSIRTTEASAMGQRIRALAERSKDSPVKYINDIVRVREEAFAQKFKNKTPKEVIKKTVGDIKKRVKIPSKSDWNSFISNLQC